MAIVITTTSPDQLLAAIREAIAEDRVRTWECDDDGDFTHSAEQWKNRAWLHPTVRGERLMFTMLPPKESEITVSVYAIYHGRFVEMILRHFDQLFSEVECSALGRFEDVLD